MEKQNTPAVTSASSKRFDSFDLFKCFAAFFVVCIHVPFRNIPSGLFNVIAYTAVPFFFLVSGFFSYYEEYDAAKIRRKRIVKIKKYLFLLLSITAVYFLFEVATSYLKNTLSEALQSYTSFSFIVGNLSAKGSHMWFVRALILLELLFLLLEPVFRKKYSVLLVLIPWLFDVLCIKYSAILFGFEIPEIYGEILTKYIGGGFVFYTAGYLFRRYETTVVSFFQKQGPVKNTAFLFILIIGALAEYGLLEHYHMNRPAVNYCSTFFLAVTVFALLMTYRSLGKGSIFNYIGREMSMYVYYWHLLIFWGGSYILCRIPVLNTLYRNPIFLFIECIIFSLLIIQVKKYLQKKGHAK